MSVDVEELIRRYENSKKGRKKGKGIAERIRQYALQKMGKQKYVPLKDIVNGLIEDGVAKELGLEEKYNVVYNRARQALINSKKAGFRLGALEDGTVVVVKVQ